MSGGKAFFFSPWYSFVDVPSVGAQSPGKLQSPVTVGPDTQPTEDDFRVFSHLLSVLIHAINIQETREEPLVIFATACRGSSIGAEQRLLQMGCVQRGASPPRWPQAFVAGGGEGSPYAQEGT